jgi:hypothetical protein
MLNLPKHAFLIGIFALLCAPAFAIPGPSVSYGANPVWSVGGYISDLKVDATVTPAIGVTGQDTIITSIVISAATGTTGSCFVTGVLSIEDSNSTLAMFGISLSTGSDRLVNESAFVAPLGSGIRVGEGESLNLSIDWTSYSHASYCGSSYGAQSLYTISGYYAAP